MEYERFPWWKNYLIDLVKKYDIVALSEHWLYPQEADLVKDFLSIDFDPEVKCSSDSLPENCNRYIGHAGVALCWRKASSHRRVKVDCDRICALRIDSPGQPLFVFSVYLPPA